jgi:hypothetical protein
MSYDYRTGIIPIGSVEVERHQIPAYPYPINFDRTTATRPNYEFWVPGTGDVRRPPKSLVALAFASEYQFNASLSTVGGSAAWSGYFTRGIYRDTDGLEEGVAITTQRQAFSRYIVNPAANNYEFASSFTRYEEFNELGEDAANNLIRIWLDPESITYSTLRDEWGILSVFDCGYDNGEGEGGSAGSGPVSGPEFTGLTVCGDEWTITGTGVFSISGSITPSAWLT